MSRPAGLCSVACLVSLAVVALSCGGGASGQPACTVPALMASCACDGLSTGRQMRDGCTTEPIGSCLCPQPMACTNGDGQPGAKICFGADCGACGLSPGSTARLWTFHGLGDVRGLAVGDDGAVFVLVRGAPWIRKFDVAGAPQPFVAHGSFESARYLGVDVDGSVVLVGPQGTPSVAGASLAVVVQRLDASGVIVANLTWGYGEPGPMVRRGRDLILSSRQSSAIALAQLTADNQLVQLASYTGTALYTLESLSLGPNDSFLLAGISRNAAFGIVGSWFARLDAKGGPQTFLAKPIPNSSSSPRVVANAAGEIYASWNNPGGGVVVRFDEALRVGWTAERGLNGAASAVVALPDGVLEVGYPTKRFDRLGREAPQAPLTDLGVQYLAPVGTRDIVAVTCLNSTECDLVRFTFGDLPTAFAPNTVGKGCVTAADCQTGRCCVAGTQAVGTCSGAATCAARSRCAGAADCADGVCLLQDPQREGVCTKPCTATGQCAAEETCAARSCLAAGASCGLACLKLCSPPQTCDAFAANLSCQPTASAENVTVSACR